MVERKKMLEERAIAEAKYCVENNATVRQVAKEFGTSKSTVHKDLTKRIPKTKEFEKLKSDVEDVLKKNKEERHYRGGESTRKKYQNLKQRRQNNLL